MAKSQITRTLPVQEIERKPFAYSANNGDMRLDFKLRVDIKKELVLWIAIMEEARKDCQKEIDRLTKEEDAKRAASGKRIKGSKK